MIYLTIIAALELALIAFLLWDKGRERDAHAREREETARRDAEERQVLLQRIQAPAAAVVEHEQRQVMHAPAAVGFDNDAEFWETKEQLADRLDGVTGGAG